MPLARVRDVSLHYEVHGDPAERRPWLVLLHGAGGNRLSWWQQVPAFRGSYRCLLLDQRGFGASAGAPASPGDLAADLDALLEHLRVDRAVLVGQSMGGWSALGAALAAPERVAGLVLTGTLAGLTDETMIADLARHHAGGPRGFDPHRALAPSYPAEEPELTFLYDQISALNPPATLTSLAALLRVRHADVAGRLRCPVLFVAGGRDQLFPLELVRRAHAKLPEAELAIVDDAGHSVYFERPAVFNRMLASFLGGLAAEPR